MTWREAASESFVARFDERDAPDAEHVLHQLEGLRARLEARFDGRVGELSVVLHPTEAQLDAAAPLLPVLRRMTVPAGRRYLVGWVGEQELHVLAPRALARRASNVEGSLETLMLAPGALLARRVVAASNPGLPPPWGPRAWARYQRWAWLIEGAGQFFSGQTHHARPLVGPAGREGGRPALAQAAAIRLACAPLPDGPKRALEVAFHSRPLRHTEGTWRAHLTRMAEGRLAPPHAERVRARA